MKLNSCLHNFLQIYVIGSSAELGQWKVQNGLKLHYAGDSIWQADCAVQKDDFPIKYPWHVVRFSMYYYLLVLIMYPKKHRKENVIFI